MAVRPVVLARDDQIACKLATFRLITAPAAVFSSL